MALTASVPGVSGLATTTDFRKDLAGVLATATSGAARPGVFPAHANALVTSRTDMNVNIAAFTAAVVQFGGPILVANDGTVQLPSALVSPGAGTNYYVIYAKVNESASPGTDANNNRIFDAKVSTTSLAAARALLPTGALELATVEMPTGKTATNQSGVVITQTHQYTATQGGVVWLRNATEQAAWSPADGSVAFRLDTQTMMLRSGGSWGLVNTGPNLITSQSFTSSSQVTLDGVFSAAFTHYVIHLSIDNTVTANITARLRSAGAAKTTSYYAVLDFAAGSTHTTTSQSNVGQWQLTGVGGRLHTLEMKVFNPAVATIRTSAVVDAAAVDLAGPTVGRNGPALWYGTTEAHDGIHFTPLSGTMTGTVMVYGYYSG